MRSRFIDPLEPRMFLATSGLTGTYFDNADFTGTAVQKVDSKVNFEFAHNSPAAGIAGSTYSVRWAGLVKPAYSQVYTFTVRSNDGARLWVNGSLLIDDFVAGTRRVRSGSIALRAGHLYDIRLEYFDSRRSAGISLQWSSSSTPQSLIPTRRLFAYDQRVAVIGDFGRTSAYAQGTARIVNSWAPSDVVTAGDNNYEKTFDATVGQYYHQYIGNYTGQYGAGAAANHFWPALGNHDWDHENSYISFFTLPGNERYYDFVVGPVHFFMLDSDKHEPDGTSPDSVQGQWLKSALAGSTSLYNIVVFHHAPYSSGHHANVGYMRWPFKQWGATTVISGHDHDYERLIEGGLLYFVDGSGAGPRSLGSPIAGSRFQNNTDSGALLVQANDLAMTFQYELRSGKVLDTYTIAARA